MAPIKRTTSRTSHLAIPASDVEARANFENPKTGFEELTKKDVELLYTLAALAKTLASHHLSDDNFKRLLRFAYGKRIVTAEKLGEIGRVDRTTASRWINGPTAPGPLAQETILAKIADEAMLQATRLIEQGQ
jgi:hypothetical protein